MNGGVLEVQGGLQNGNVDKSNQALQEEYANIYFSRYTDEPLVIVL